MGNLAKDMAKTQQEEAERMHAQAQRTQQMALAAQQQQFASTSPLQPSAQATAAAGRGQSTGSAACVAKLKRTRAHRACIPSCQADFVLVPQAEGRAEAGDEGEAIKTGARAGLAAPRVATYTHRRGCPRCFSSSSVNSPHRGLSLQSLDGSSSLIPVPFAGRVGVIPPAMRRMERRSLN
jgi:hypothetical protein